MKKKTITSIPFVISVNFANRACRLRYFESADFAEIYCYIDYKWNQSHRNHIGLKVLSSEDHAAAADLARTQTHTIRYFGWNLNPPSH